MKMLSRIITVLLILVITFSCRKKNTEQESNHPVPYVPVNIVIYPGDPLNFPIQSIGGWKYINGGINGIIVYRKSQQEFVALERTSSYLPDDPGARVKVLPDNFTLRDTISDSKWQIVDGTVINGPAQWALRIYGTSFDGNALRIRN